MHVYTTQPDRIYDSSYFDAADDEGMGWVGAVIGAGSSILGPLIGKLFAPCGGANVACGLQGISQFGNQAISTLRQIKGMVQSRPPQVSPADAVSNAQRIADALGDSSIVYQAKKGKDAAALLQFKSQAAMLVQEIQAEASKVQVSSPASPVSVGGLSINPTILLLGGGLALLLLVKK